MSRARREYALPFLVAVSYACGFMYAAQRAELWLKPAFPLAYEQRDASLTVFVRGLPEASDAGTRLLFEVESNGAGLHDFPRLIRLVWMPSPAARDRPATPPMLEAGQRWTLAARLKRAHSVANFGLRDMEVSMLERGIRATGYVSISAMPRRFRHDAHGPLLAIERIRSRLRARMESALADAPHRGIVIALAVGAQDAVGEADWSLMRATGTNHLVAISGLHIGFVAALGAVACGSVWQRLRIRSMPAALIVATPRLGAGRGPLRRAVRCARRLQRARATRAVDAARRRANVASGGRRPASSLVLCWALAFVVIADPWAVTSPGFWLSFCAVAAIIYAMERAAGARRKKRQEPDVTFESLDWNDRGEAAHVAALIEADDLVERVERRFGSVRIAMTVARLRTPVERAARVVGRAIASAFSTLASHVRSGALVQFPVTLALAPLTAYWFSQIPLIGPLANAFAIPWVSFAVTSMTLAGVLPAAVDILCDALAASADLAMRRHLASPLWRLPRPGAFALASACAGVVWRSRRAAGRFALPRRLHGCRCWHRPRRRCRWARCA